MKAEELKNGLVVCHTKYNRLYYIEECNMRMKDSQKGWIDAVVYAPLYENNYDAFCREKESFLEEFNTFSTDATDIAETTIRCLREQRKSIADRVCTALDSIYFANEDARQGAKEFLRGVIERGRKRRSRI